MKLLKKNEIVDITHDDLVNFFSTALYGSIILSGEYDKDFYKSLTPEQKQGDCYEDKMADCLLNGGNVYIYDNEAEGEVYSGLGECVDNGEDEPYVFYALDLANLVAGLEGCCNSDDDWLNECFDDFYSDNGNFDQGEGEALLQYVLFGEVVYG